MAPDKPKRKMSEILGLKKSKRPKAKPLPVTLLSGFLGSGKTTTLQHILKSEHGLRVAIIVNDIGAINVDAALIKKTNHRLTRTEEKVVELQNGCICCTLRGDLLEELVHLHKLNQFDYIVIESSGISEPEQVAETFDAKLAQQMIALGQGDDGLDESMKAVLKEIGDAGGLEKFAFLDTTVTVIDALTILSDFHTDQLISYNRNDVPDEDERTVSDLMVDQIEFADVILLNKTDMVNKEDLQRIKELIAQLNKRAKVHETKYGEIEMEKILNTGLFNLENAQSGAGWLQDLHEMTLREVNGRKKVTPKPETEEYNVRNFIYKRERPFHPRRLWELVYDKFILQMEHPDEEDGDDDDEEDDASETGADGEDAGDPMDEGDEAEDAEEDLEPPSNQVILANKSNHPLLAKLFRSKGGFFLATRPYRMGEWSQAGAMLTLTGGTKWFCLLDKEDWMTGVPDIDKLVQFDIDSGGTWGDRRQELVFIGEKLDIKGISDMLDRCLLNDEEFAQWEEVMKASLLSEKGKLERLFDLFPDGFPDWPEDEDDHENDHNGHHH